MAIKVACASLDPTHGMPAVPTKVAKFLEFSLNILEIDIFKEELSQFLTAS